MHHRRIRPRLVGGAVLLLTLLASVPASAQIGRWRPEERTLITDVSSVSSLARGNTELYIASRGGLVIYNDAQGYFRQPVTVVDGYPPEGATAMAYDDRSAMLWIAGVKEMYRFDPFAGRFIQSFRLPAPVSSIVPGGFGDSDLFIRTNRGWLRFATFSGRTSPASASEVQAAIERNPDLRRRAELLRDTGFGVLAGFLGQTPDGRRFAVTDVMPAWEGSLFWVATAGNFVVEYDAVTRRWQGLAYGFLGQGVGATAVTPEGIWFGPLAREKGRFGVSVGDPSLQHWQLWDAFDARTAPGGGVRAMLAQGDIVWAGGVTGLHAFQPELGAWRPVATGTGGASTEVLSLAHASNGGVWVGTRRGAVRLSSAAVAVDDRILAQERIFALAETTGWLWLGTARGLYRYELTSGRLVPPKEESMTLTQPVAAMATRGDTLFVGVGREVWIFPPGENGLRFDLIAPGPSPITALATGANEVWVGSQDGILRWSSVDNELNRLSFSAGDIPSHPGLRDAVLHILPIGPREVWASLPAGALRISAIF